MKRSIKTMLAALVMSLSLAVPVVAGPMEDARDAYIRKDYATALRLWLPLAEQGDAQAQSNLGSLYYGGRGRAAGLREGDEVVPQGGRTGQR